MTVALIILGSIAVVVVGIRWCGRELRHIVEIDSKLYPTSELRRRQIDNEIARGRAGSPHPADMATGGYVDPGPTPPHGVDCWWERGHLLDRAFPEMRKWRK